MATKEFDWTKISKQRKLAIRAQLFKNRQKVLRQKGASKVAGGDPTKVSAAATLSGLSGLEREYAARVQKTQAAKRKANPKTYKVPGQSKTSASIQLAARKSGRKNKALVTAVSMRDKNLGGTVGFGTHKTVKGKVGGGAKRAAAKAWRTKHMGAATGTAAQKAAHHRKVQKRFEHMIGKAPVKTAKKAARKTPSTVERADS